MAINNKKQQKKKKTNKHIHTYIQLLLKKNKYFVLFLMKVQSNNKNQLQKQQIKNIKNKTKQTHSN